MNRTAAMSVSTLAALAAVAACGQELLTDDLALATSSADQAIVGGAQIASQAEMDARFPWIVAVAQNAPTDWNDTVECGGSLIDVGDPTASWVATAAHCVFDERGRIVRPSSLRVGVSSLRLSDLPIARDGVSTFVVSAIKVHPGYDPRDSPYDVALLKLDGVAPVAGITLASPNDAALLADLASQAPVTIAGWGNTTSISWRSNGSERMSYPDQLRWTSITTTSPDACEASLRDVESSLYGDAAFSVHATELCAIGGDGTAAKRADTCYGDSGGPLVFTDEAHGPVLAGITSFGYGCGSARDGASLPGVYTRVSAVSDWVKSCIGDASTCNDPSFL